MYRVSAPFVLALVLLMVLPAHVMAASPASVASFSGGPLPRIPTVGSPMLAPEPSAGGLAGGVPPVAMYPSDAYGPRTDAGPGPVPLLSSAIDRHGFRTVWAQGLHGEGVTAAIVDQGTDFGHPDLNTSFAIEGNTSSPYYGWPLAFDPKSMSAYLRTGIPEGTWYANTSRAGPGPFEITHTIKVDGTNDFGQVELVGTDPRDNTVSGAGGDKLDFDLTDLYMTRDADRWYFGFNAYLKQSNNSYVLLLDTDNETSGTTTVPAGKLADTNTSHADSVTDVAFRPDGQRVATVGADRYLRVWDLSGRVLYSVQAHTAKPSSVAWSPDGSMIATADPNMLRIWDAATGQVRWQVQYVPLADISIDENAVLAWAPNSTWVAAGTARYVHIINAQTGQRFGTLWASNVQPVNAVRFNRLGTQIAAGLGDGTGTIAVFDVNATNIRPYPPSTRAFSSFVLSGVHTNAVLDIAWSSDDTQMISGGKDNRVVLWNVAARTGAGNTAPGSWVTGVEWRKDGLGYVSVSAGLAPLTPPRLTYWRAGGVLDRQIDLRAAMTGVDTSATYVATSSADMSARLWDLFGNPVRILVFHKPDYAIVADGWSRYSDRDQAFVHGLDIATFYRWNVSSLRWEGTGFFDPSVNGTQASFQFGERLFNELSIPRDLIGNPANLSMEMFSAGRAATKPQDSVPTDPNVNFKNLDFTLGSLSVGAFVYRHPGSYTIDSAIVSRSGTFHFGYHPSPILTRTFGPIGLLVVDPTTAGTYDTVYADLDNNHRFDATDVRLDRASPLASLDSIDHATGAPGRDGIADVSGGILYFIANGTVPIPYSDRYVALQLVAQPNLKNRIPGNGDLLAFAGEFGLDPITGTKADHGTRIASLLVGQGRLNPPAQGVAPAVKLLALGNALDDVVSSWYFAVEGYDGQPGTGDEAQVVLNPFNYPALPNDGFDVYSRTADYLSYVRSGGRALFVAPTGDYGFGYGSIAAPASAPAVLAVGRVEDGTVRSRQEGGTEGWNAHYLDVAVPSGRGPAAAGFPKPDLVAIGTAIADVPIQSAPGDGMTAVSSAPMTGTDVAAAVAAGAAAIVRQAFARAWGQAPLVDELAAILRSGAVDLSYDAFEQGSGFLDVAASVRLAAGEGGLLVSPATLLPGGYRGARAAAYPHLIPAGGSDTLPLLVENRGTATTTVTVTDAAYVLLGSYTFANTTVQDLYSASGDITFWLNASGVSKVNGTTLSVTRLSPPIPGAWAAADLVKVTASSEISGFVFKQGTAYRENYTYTLSALDWQANASNWIGLPYGPFPAPTSFPDELNTVSQTSNIANVLEVRAQRPAATVRDGLAVRLSESLAGSGLLGVRWTFTIELYRRADWAWITPSTGSFSLAARRNATVNVAVTVPAGTGLGLYEGFVLVANQSSGRTTAVPIVVNVGSTGTDFRLGGNPVPTPLYDNSRFFGGNDYVLNTAGTALLRTYTGDWRFYYVDVPDSGMFENPHGLKLIIDLRWTLRPSDLDIVVFGRASADSFSTGAGERYGPAPLSVRGKTDELTTPEFKTATNESEDVLTVDLKGGLNVIGIHVTRLNGTAPEEWGTGVAGWARVRPSVDISTPDLAGQASFTFLTSLNLTGGLRASAVGPASTTSFQDLPIPQDWQSWWNFPNFGEFLWRGSFNYSFNLTKALILEVHLKGKADVSDLDLGVFRDINGNGKLDTDEVKDANSKNRGGNEWMYDADGDADETVKWLAPADGLYFVKVLGFTVNANPGHFDLDVSITLATGKGYEVPEAPKPTEIVRGTESGLAPFTPVGFTMAWDFPGETKDGDYGGAVLLGLPAAPGVLIIPVNVGLDRVPPSIVGFSLAALNGRLDRADNRTTTDASPTLTWTLSDPVRGELDWTRTRVALDGADVTADASITVQLTQNAALAWGFWDGTVKFVPRALPVGVHEIRLEIGDMAGNAAFQTIVLILDTTAPPLVIEGPSLRFTRDAYATLTVDSEPGAHVSFGGPWIDVDASGRVTTSLSLTPGANEFKVTVADWFDVDTSGNPVPGNAKTAVVTVVQDTTPPRYSRAPNPDAAITRSNRAVISGTIQEFITQNVSWPASDTVLTVAGTPTPVSSDGTFLAVVPLVEGDNAIFVRATDLAGNEAPPTWANVTRDTQAPALSVDPMPTRVTSGYVTVSGHADAGALVTINGAVAPVTGTGFSKDVPLSGGANVIVVRAEDLSGNVAEQRFAVEYHAEPTPVWQWASIVIGLGVLVALIAFLLGRNYLFAQEEGAVEEEALEAPSEEQAAPATPTGAEAPLEPEEIPEEEKDVAEGDEFARIEQAPPGREPPAAPEDPRVAKLREAYASGRISREAYEANLQRLGGAVPAEEPEDPRLVKLREAFRSGKISREAYEANLRRLGKQP